jgi:hypothetical protein
MGESQPVKRKKGGRWNRRKTQIGRRKKRGREKMMYGPHTMVDIWAIDFFKKKLSMICRSYLVFFYV